ncbi:MAG: TlpA disulfide reductase family protein [Aridibacter sp.]
MKNIIKNLALFIILSITISGFIACNNSTETSSEKTSDVKTETASDEKAEEDGFPPAPDVIVKTDLRALDGENFKIEDFKGDVLLVNLWATWCGPCIKEMPELVAMQEKYGDKGFKVIGLNTSDEPPEQVKAFVEKQKLNYKIGWATDDVIQKIFQLSEMSGIPQSIIINRNGNMTGIFRGGGPEAVQKMMETVDKTMAE